MKDERGTHNTLWPLSCVWRERADGTNSIHSSSDDMPSLRRHWPYRDWRNRANNMAGSAIYTKQDNRRNRPMTRDEMVELAGKMLDAQIANLGYPVGCGIGPHPKTVREMVKHIIDAISPALIAEGEAKGIERAAAIPLQMADQNLWSAGTIHTVARIASAIRNLTPQAPCKDGWQPIASAPKDGTPVLLLATRLGWPGSARVCGFYHYRQWRIYGCASGEPKAGGKEVQCLDQVEPTYWMPLPATPCKDENGKI